MPQYCNSQNCNIIINVPRINGNPCFGFKIKITLEHILLNELPSEKLKNTPEERRKTWFAILNSYKTTIYSLYYLRPAAIFCTEIADNLCREIVVPVGLLQVLGLWRGCTIGDF